MVDDEDLVDSDKAAAALIKSLFVVRPCRPREPAYIFTIIQEAAKERSDLITLRDLYTMTAITSPHRHSLIQS